MQLARMSRVHRHPSKSVLLEQRKVSKPATLLSFGVSASPLISMALRLHNILYIII